MRLQRYAGGLAILMLVGLSPAHAQTNSCSDPYWATTLRCQLVPGAPPQPSPAPPANVAQIKPYTRVNLPFDPNLRCLDGTRPIFYVDKAVGAPSNKWLITMGGGEFCYARDLDGNGSYEDGDRCLDYYVDTLGLFMGTANAEAMSALNDDNGNGIHKPDPRVNPVFAGYNRVRVHKCGYDRHSGRATHLGVSGDHPLTGPVTFDLYNHGQKIVLAVIDALEGAGQAGLTYPTWINNGGNVSVAQESLPSIADAEQVVFVGHSAAAHGLYQNIDRYAAYLRAKAGFNGDVRVIHDAHFMHAPENEAAFDPARNPDPLNINTLFSQHHDGNSSLFGLYNAMPYFTTTFVADDYPAWLETPLSPLSTLVDQSCLASHQAADAWKCTDRFHVRLHHETTPSLVREDFLDPGTEHNNHPLGHVVQWGPLAARPECAELGFAPCPPVLTLQQNAARLSMQARHFLEGVHTRSELATGADSSGTPGSVFLWMPTCAWHSGAYSDSQFFRVGIAQDGGFLTFRQFAEMFVQAPATGVIFSRVSGLAGAFSDCGTMAADGFEPNL